MFEKKSENLWKKEREQKIESCLNDLSSSTFEGKIVKIQYFKKNTNVFFPGSGGASKYSSKLYF